MIGELNEKQIHNELKNRLEPDKQKQEINLGYGIGIADILREDQEGIEAIEIQTKQFFRLKKKLDYYIENNIKTVVVFPIAIKTTIHWIDPVQNVVVQSTKRQKQIEQQKHQVFKELYAIQDYLQHIELKIYFVDIDDYRYLDGYGMDRKKRQTKIDKEINNIVQVMTIKDISQYRQFIPSELYKLEHFTQKEYKKYQKSDMDTVRKELLVLYNIGIIRRVGKTGNNIVYSIK